MAYLIGTDEAGYGPNLGPLVISATLWQLPHGVDAGGLYELLRDTVAPALDRSDRSADGRIAVADSKLLYQPGKGLRHLERGVLAALATLGRRPATWRETWSALSPDSVCDRDALVWYSDYDAPVPVDLDLDQLAAAARRLSEGLATAGVRLVEMRSRVVFENQFNLLVDRYGTKGESLSQVTLGLVAELAASVDGGPIAVVCDKHGGRNRYGRILADHFPETLVEIYGEARELSVYRFGPAERRVEVRFCTGAECYLPAALASMASKYLRELAMRALNDYWCGRVPGLVRTAGYPGDARRFKEAIATAQAALGIEDRMVWRSR